MSFEHLLEIRRRLEVAEGCPERSAFAVEITVDKFLHRVSLGEPLEHLFAILDRGAQLGRLAIY